MELEYYTENDKAVLGVLEEVASSNGWDRADIMNSEDFDGNPNYGITLARRSKAGQDFHITLVMGKGETLPSLQEQVEVVHDEFDVSYNAYLWLDGYGHGGNGAPYEMVDVYNDMKECKEAIKELSYQLLKACVHGTKR